MLERRDDGRGGDKYRTSQTSPSVAVCFFVLSSLITRSWRVADSRGAASWRSRIFWGGWVVNGCLGGFEGLGKYLDVSEHVVFNGCESYRAQYV